MKAIPKKHNVQHFRRVIESRLGKNVFIFVFQNGQNERFRRRLLLRKTFEIFEIELLVMENGGLKVA